MKGISTILAMILIVIIVVALIGLTYTFAVGLFSTTSGTATNQVTTTTTRLDKQVSFIGTVTCQNNTAAAGNWTVTFTVRHNGATWNINDAVQNELTAILDSTVIPDANTKLVGGATTLGTQPIKPGELKTFSLWYQNTTGAFTGSHTLTISAPAGEMPMQITCTAK
jgi:FlaG/FlaF family flagellin (archaellin)